MELNDFLVKAKKNTYASNGEGGEKKLEDGTKELVYEEGEFKYRDRYFGSKDFVGEEIVWKNNQPIWGMNYFGFMLPVPVDSKKFLEFLKKALSEVETSKPFRGPDQLNKGDFIYANSAHGTIENFHGEEVIFYLNERVYRLFYHGGAIK